MIKAVLFDVDGVLLDSFEANLKFFQNLFKEAGYDSDRPTREEYVDLFHKTMKDMIQLITGSKDKEEIQRIWLMGKNRAELYPDELLSTPKDAYRVVKELKEIYRLGIVTSRVKEGLGKRSQLARILPYFETSIVYEDTENHKPHPEPLLLAAKRLNIEPKYCVYIGDAQNDIIAATSAGMSSIAYPGELEGAHAWTADFSALPNVIKNLHI